MPEKAQLVERRELNGLRRSKAKSEETATRHALFGQNEEEEGDGYREKEWMTPEWKAKEWRPMPKYVETMSECVKSATAGARQCVVVKNGDQVKPVAAGAAVPEKAQPVEQRELDGHLERCAQQKKSTIGELCGVSIIDGLKHVGGVVTEHELLSSTCQLRGSRLRRRFKLNAEATSFNPWNPWLAEGDAGSKREQSLVANDDLWEHFRKYI